jgi:hypothetical protein
MNEKPRRPSYRTILDSETYERLLEERSRTPALVITIPLEGVPHLVPVTSTFGEEVRLARWVDRLLTRHNGLIYEAIASWILLVEDELAA